MAQKAADSRSTPRLDSRPNYVHGQRFGIVICTYPHRSAIFNFQRTWLQKFDGVSRTIGLPFCQGGTVSACSGHRFVGGPIRTPGKKGSTILLTSSRAIGASFVAPESPMADFCSDEKVEANAIWRWARTCGHVEGMRPKGKRVTKSEHRWNGGIAALCKNKLATCTLRMTQKK